MVNIHQKYMSRAIQIGRSGLGPTAPNPMVGAVIVHDGQLIGEGYTSAFGGPHAEVNAIDSVADKTLLKRSTLYVTLEPCSHFGKTPPCADLIIEHRIPTVVVGLKDPHKKVAGQGIEKLRRAGVQVITGILEPECREHHKRFLTYHEKKRPYILLKWAETEDGFIAPDPIERHENPEPFWISTPYSRQLVHRWRSEEQAILVGTTTVWDDNPKLDVRLWTGESPLRVILDRNLKIQGDYHVLDGSHPTLILTEVEETSRYLDHLEYRILDFSKEVTPQICSILYEYGILSVLVEGGAQTLQSFGNAGLWDEIRLFTGTSSFKKGLKAPTIPGKSVVSKKNIGSDVLRMYKNDRFG
ncbi:bifunctional diaminohydroxyphosphoribosylaminopyrimidine deaminase/5-amino-6-(5-phosphoribosylamino)uracil reductase RibD [Pricia sp. S334]|uniref:Riboflavin biosynthesis protein RibD n=1 Tax=Pricia mediterranea TaxID=3076079 RepID=A0ABU3LBI2_9FLAO|nr:bifunctional diaminohydroxyphosphoribosylaminopyrimidine deaminase/5-amino-6-(5-phosphoribosylamino)uracil reductase RibD [Pricia sp. S334]MDT7830641.1 bifunctional diaminohydroxyphosphoribosylaminopyrimidine deaminase/5-amino-6-(5-phosphoribosylamino)uracil reductase RibD [Pricia sp. S334]